MDYEYQVGGNLPIESPTYVKRRADQDLYNGLKAGEFCYVLNSRQMGKSSLRVQTMHRLQADQVACGVIDLTTIGIEQVTLEQWYASLIDSLIKSFKLKLKLVSWWRDRTLLSPVQRLSEFFESVLLVEIETPIVIFIDEIDSVLSLKFPVEDFFAAIRACYNQRAENPAFKRLTFALFGVATPSDLMQDKKRTPFNVGRAIELKGFQLEEAQPLAQGLASTVKNPQTMLSAILNWTGGQPFLTQKLCKLIGSTALPIAVGEETTWLQQLVQSQIVENWEFQDEPTHLKTIRDRLLRNGERAGQLLGLYQQILQSLSADHPGVAADDSPEQIELRLSGLVVEHQGYLKVYNPIYAAIFDAHWVARVLADLRPYGEALAAWITSNQDESWLLRGQALRDAQQWAEGKRLSNQDYWFLDASRELATRAVQEALETERHAKEIAEQANQILREARQKAEIALEEEKQANQRLLNTQRQIRRIVRIELSVLALISMAGVGVGVQASLLLQAADTQRQEGEIAMLNASSQLLLSDDDHLGALVASVKASQQLLKLETAAKIKGAEAAALHDQTENSLQSVIYSIQESNRLKGHLDKINSVSFSPDGQLLASASDDETIKLWTPTGRLLQTLSKHPGGVESVSFSPDSQTLVSGGQDSTVKLWNRTGTLIKTLTGHRGAVTSTSFSPDGQLIASASWDNTIKLWNRTGEAIATPQPMSHLGAVYTLSFSPDSQWIASAGEHRDIKVWDRQGQELYRWQAHNNQINSVSFSPDGQMLASASNDGVVKLWSVQGKLLKTFPGHQGAVYSLSFSPDGQTLAAASQDGTVKLWRIQDSTEIQSLQKHSGPIYGVSFSPDSQTLATSSYDSTIKLWRPHNPLRQDFKGHTAEVNSVSFSPDGQKLVTASQDGTVKLWGRNGRFLTTLTQHGNWFQSARFSPDGQAIATASRDRTVKLWDLNGKLLKTLSGHRGRVYSVSFSPDGQTLATASYDSTAKLWNRHGDLLTTLRGHKGNVYDISFSPDGQTLATASYDGTAKLWNRQGDLLKTFSGHRGRVYSVSFSPNGQILATASHDQTVKLWNLKDGTLITTIEVQGGRIYSVSFSPDGQTLATGSHDETIKIWNLNGKLLKTLRGHHGPIESVSFSPDGQAIASASRDRTAIIWQLNTPLDILLGYSCQWLQDYLQSQPDGGKGVCDR
ncbi:MAG: AAA-like domain-containing protein [Leptolyngbyaceae bacterium]|nr:AAA-like domain-containing protein [Leptolyngbyaceae bacterium]